MEILVGIAIDTYADPDIKDLSNCLQSVNAIIEVLCRKYQFGDSELLFEADQTTNSFVFHRLYDILYNALEDDNIIIVFSGHGEYHEALKKLYWLTSDSKRQDITTWFSVSELLDILNASKAKHIALILDNCYAGGIFETSRGGGILAIENKHSREALTSGSIETVSDGLPGDLSPFTYTLLQCLEENDQSEITFRDISERTIKNFPNLRKQTPMAGVLPSCGDKGGSLFLRKKIEFSKLYVDQTLHLGMNTSVEINSDVTIPFINKNSTFNNAFLNAYIQQLGFTIINDARHYFLTEEQNLIAEGKHSFHLEAGYTIHTFSDKYLSISISRFYYFGGAHPNNEINTLNFAFNPERIVHLLDVINIGNMPSFEDFLNQCIELYADEDAKEFIRDYTQYIKADKCDFTFNDQSLTIYFINVMPRALMPYSFLEVPLDKLILKEQ